MAIQALDTSDMQQSSLGRTLNTATRIPQNLIDARRNEVGQNVSARPNTAGALPARQYGSGSMVGNMFSQVPIPVYTSMGGTNLPQNPYEWDNSQWARYFAQKGPSNTWDKDTWDMFNMVSSYGPKSWYVNRSNYSSNKHFYDINLDPGFVDIYNDSVYKGVKDNTPKEEPSGMGFINMGPGQSYRFNKESQPLQYKSAEKEYDKAVTRQMSYEKNLLDSYAALEKYAADKTSWDEKHLLMPYRSTFEETNPRVGWVQSYGTGTSIKPKSMFENMRDLYDPVGRSAGMSLEQIKDSMVQTPLMDLGYTETNRPVYNPSFTVEGVRGYVSETKDPWVNTYVKKEMDRQKREGSYNNPAAMSQSGIQGIQPQGEMLSQYNAKEAFPQNKRRRFL